MAGCDGVEGRGWLGVKGWRGGVRGDEGGWV